MTTTTDTSRATPPANIIAFARSMRSAFGPGVRLLYWRDEVSGESQGRAENDFPANPDAITGDNG